MFKRMNIIFGVMALIFIFPLITNAKEFKDGEITYNLEELNLTCSAFNGTEYVLGMDKNDNFFFAIDEEYYYKVNENGCIQMNNQEVLDMYNGGMYDNERITHYNLKEDGAIYSEKQLFFEVTMAIKTKDTTIIEGKSYYEESETGLDIVVSPDVSQLGNYYEEIRVKYPESMVIDSNIIYYEENGRGLKEVENPTSENILNYYITYEGEAYEEQKVLTLDDKVIELINNNITGEIMYDEEKKEAYFPLVDPLTSEFKGIYNSNGEQVSTNKIVKLVKYSNSLYGGISLDKTFVILNENFETLYEEEKELEEPYYELKADKENIYFMALVDEKFNFYHLTIETPNEFEVSNPDTFDGIYTSFILGILSLMGLLGSTIYFKKKINRV